MMGNGCASRVNAAWACYLALSSTLIRSAEISRSQNQPISNTRDYIRLLDAKDQKQWWKKEMTCDERTKFINDLAKKGVIPEEGRIAIVSKIQEHCQSGLREQVNFDVISATSPNRQTRDEVSDFPSPSSLFSTDAGNYFDSLVKINRDYLSKIRSKANEWQNHYKDYLAQARKIIDQHFATRMGVTIDQIPFVYTLGISHRSCFHLLDEQTLPPDVAKQKCSEMKHKCAAFECTQTDTICRICVGIGTKSLDTKSAGTKNTDTNLYKKTASHLEWDAYNFEVNESLQKFEVLRQEREKQIRKNHMEVEDMFQTLATTSQRSQELEDLKKRTQKFSQHWQKISFAVADRYIKELREFISGEKAKIVSYQDKLTAEESKTNDEVINNTELALHVKGSSCWVAVSGTVFDISYILLAHPTSLETYCGTNATEHYTAMHRGEPDISRSMGTFGNQVTLAPEPDDSALQTGVKFSWDFKEDDLFPTIPFGTASFMQSPSVADNMVAEPSFLQVSGSSHVRLVRKMDT